jgi:AcrR family transcriptional regulator
MGATDEEILARIAELMTQANGENITMERIAAETGLGRATLYRRFGSRGAILRRAAERSGLDAGKFDQPDAPTRILQAARTVFGQYGFAAATVEQIAQAANVGPVTIYRRFGSKEGLIDAFVQASSPRQLLRQMVTAEPGPLAEGLTLFAVTALHFLHENRDLIRLGLMEYKVDSTILAKLRGSRERTVANLARYFQRQMEAGQVRPADPFAMALAFTGMLFSFAVMGPLLYNQPVAEPEQTARLVVDWFLMGVAASKKEEP